jgi:iron(III) transport system substrate-binding protein
MKCHLVISLAYSSSSSPCVMAYLRKSASQNCRRWILYPPESDRPRLVEGARAEGEAVIYLNLDPIVGNALAGGFMKKYPGVNVQVGRFSGASIITRVDADARAGKLAADAIMSGELGILVLVDKGVVARYRSP